MIEGGDVKVNQGLAWRSSGITRVFALGFRTSVGF